MNKEAVLNKVRNETAKELASVGCLLMCCVFLMLSSFIFWIVLQLKIALAFGLVLLLLNLYFILLIRYVSKKIANKIKKEIEF